jgi:hypothetical protein
MRSTPIDYRARMVLLCQTFHPLRGRPGTNPWEPEALIRSLRRDDWTPASADCATFVLSVWNAEIGRERPALRFNFAEAFGRWDQQNRDAFLAWAHAPFWP